MKKFVSLFILVLFLTISAHAQNVFSRQYIAAASAEQLKEYLIKAHKQKKKGTIMSIAGPVTALTGIYLFNGAWAGNIGGSGTATMGLLMFIGGTGATLIGVPLLIIGSTRVNRINEVLATSHNRVKLDLKPSAQYNLITQNYQPGLTLRIRF